MKELARLSLNVPAPTHKALRVKAATEGTTVSALCRAAIDKLLEKVKK